MKILAEILEAEEDFREDRYEEAFQKLSVLQEKYPKDGRISFDFGNIFLHQLAWNQAIHYYELSENQGYDNYGVYINWALACEKTEDFDEAELCYKKALSCTDAPEERLHTLSCLTLHYGKRNMYLKAQKTAKEMIKSFPTTYMGHHLYVGIKMKRRHYEEASIHFDEIRNEFGNYEQFLIDEVTNLELAGKDEKVLSLLESNPVVYEVIPQWALRKKIHLLIRRKDFEYARKEIDRLLEEFQDVDGGISVIILEIMDEKYVEAARHAGEIMEQIRDRDSELFYIAMCLQMTALEGCNRENQDKKIQALIEKEKMLIEMFFMDSNNFQL